MMGMVVNHDHNHIHNQKYDFKPLVTSPPEFDPGPMKKKKKMRYPPFNFNYYAANDNHVLDCMARFIDQVDYDFH